MLDEEGLSGQGGGGSFSAEEREVFVAFKQRVIADHEQRSTEVDHADGGEENRGE